MNTPDRGADHRVDPVPAGDAPHDRRPTITPTEPERVGEHLEVGALHVEALLGPVAQQQRTRPRSPPARSTPTTSTGTDAHVGRVAEPARPPRTARSRRPRTAARRWPARRGSRAGRGRTSAAGATAATADAAWIAASAMPRPRASVAMCPASDSRASEPVAMPTTTCTTRNDTISANAINSGRTCRAPARAAAGPWWWPWASPIGAPSDRGGGRVGRPRRERPAHLVEDEGSRRAEHLVDRMELDEQRVAERRHVGASHRGDEVELTGAHHQRLDAGDVRDGVAGPAPLVLVDLEEHEGADAVPEAGRIDGRR